MDNNFVVFAGIDWATEKNDVCVIDANGESRKDAVFPATSDGLHQLCEFLAAYCDGNVGSLGIAIEVPHGAVVET